MICIIIGMIYYMFNIDIYVNWFFQNIKHVFQCTFLRILTFLNVACLFFILNKHSFFDKIYITIPFFILYSSSSSKRFLKQFCAYFHFFSIFLCYICFSFCSLNDLQCLDFVLFFLCSFHNILVAKNIVFSKHSS